MTLNQLCDDILLEARNNNIGESEKLSKRLIELWIKSYRAMLIKQKLDKGEDLDSMFKLTIRMELLQKEIEPGHIEYQGNIKLPALIHSKKTSGIISVKDAYGNIIQVGDETKMKFQKYRRYTCKDYIAYKLGDRVYVEGNDNQLKYIDVAVIAEDPTENILCYNPETDEYPIPMSMWPTVKDLIFTKDIGILIKMASDITNNSEDNNLNIYSTKK